MSDIEGTGVARLGRARLCAKVCAVMLGLSLAVFGFCAAYVISSGATLFVLNAAVLSFFVSLAASFLSMLGCLVFSVKLSAVDKYDLSIPLPNGSFPSCGSGAGAVRGSSVRAEVTVNAGSRRLCAFDGTSTVMALTLAAALCVFTTSLGVVAAQNAAVGVAGLVSAVIAPTVIGQVCLAALAVTLSVLVINFLRHDLFGKSTQLMVLEDGNGKFADRDVRLLAKQVNLSPYDITHIKISHVDRPVESVGNSPLVYV